MADRATFHAKISADARQFVEQVKEATDSLNALVSAYDKAGKQGAKAQKSTGTKEARQAEKNVDDVYDRMQQRQKEVSTQAIENIRKENAERAKGFSTASGYDVRPTRGVQRLEGPGRDIGDITKLISGYKEIRREESLISSQAKAEQEDLRRVAADNRKMMDAMVTGRYALYDVANAYRQIGQAGIMATKALSQTVVVAMQFESAFTAVERALKLEAGSAEFLRVRDMIIDMTKVMPASFAELTEIATLGAQMGIEIENIKDFTETVAKFTTVTNISVDEAAEKFGRLAALAKVPTAEFENLGSAVIFAGFNAVATEGEILKVSESIAAAAAKSGFAAKEIVGLATALASLGIQPELSRGALTRIFAQITNAVEGSSGKLREFSNIAGVSADAARELFQADPEAFFRKFVRGLGDVESLTQTLRQLGIVNVRDIDVLTRLVNSFDVYTKSIDEASEAYEKGTELAKLYGQTADDLEQRIKVLQNAFTALLNELGEGAAEALKPAVDALTNFVNVLTEVSKNPIMKFLVPLAGTVAAVVAAFGTLAFAMNIAKASLLAMQVATIKMAQLNRTAWSFSIGNVIQQLKGQVFAITTNTGALKLMTKAQIEAAVAAGTVDAALARTTLSAGRASFAVRGVTLAFTALKAATAVGFLLVIGTTLFEIAKSAGVFGETTEQTAKRMKELGEAGVSAAGGLDNVRRAMAADAAAYSATNAQVAATVKAEENRVKSLANLEDAQGRVNDALRIGISGYGDYEKAVGKGEDVDLDVAERKGKEYRDVLIRSVLGTPDPETGISFISQFLLVDGRVKSALEEIGFDYAKMVEASFASGADGSGAKDYVDTLLKDLNNFMRLGYDSVAQLRADFDDGIISPEAFTRVLPLMERFEALAAQSGLSAGELRAALLSGGYEEFAEAARKSAIQVDATNTEVDSAVAAQKELDRVTGTTNETLEDQADLFERLSKEIQQYISEIGLLEGSGQAAAIALESFADGIKEGGNSLTDFTKESQTNLNNWRNFVKAAFESAAISGRGVIGGVEDVISALIALEAAGIATDEVWELTKTGVVQAVQTMGTEYAWLASALASAPNMGALRAIVAEFIATQVEAGKAGSAIVQTLQGILDALSGQGSAAEAWAAALQRSFNRVRTSSGRVKTALEQLKEAVDRVFASFDRDIRLGDSIRRFGGLLEENGKTFNRFTEAGARNVSGLQNIINELATQSGGNVQKFANSLVTLREALVRTGVGASGLRFIDDQLKRLGVTGVASANQVNRFFHILKQGAAAAAGDMKPLVDIINQLTSSIQAGLQARFAYGNALDDVALGWLDLSDAAKTAQEAIDRARESIDRANQSIREAQANIQGLAADKNKLEYQLQIAIKYGDTIRANQIRADLAKIDADIAREQENISKSQNDIQKAYQDIRKAEGELGLSPDTRQIIQRNRALQDMAGKYANVAAWMLSTAGEGADLNQIIEDQVSAFEANARQLGYTETEIKAVTDALRAELIKAMNEIPADISTTIKADTSGALANINTFVRDANNRLASIKDKVVTVTTINRQVTVTEPARPLAGGFGGVLLASKGGYITGPGSATSDSIAARLSNGEYVIQAAAVQHYGVDFFNALNRMTTIPAQRLPSAGSAGMGEQMVYLSPEDRQLLRAAIDRPIALYTENATIARSANAGNQVLAQRGAN